MKILHTQHLYAPQVGGSEEVIKQLSERLARRGHNVTVATASHPDRTTRQINGVAVESFAISGTSATRVRGAATEIKRYQDFLRQSGADVTVNSCAQSWSTDLTFPILAQIPSAKVLIPSGYSGLHQLLYLPYYYRLPRYLRQYDQLIYFSENYQDKQFGDRHGIKNYTVIPNAAAEEEFSVVPLGFRQKYKITTRYMAVTIGNHYQGKGHQRVIDAFRALNRDDVSLIIIGKPVEAAHDSCYDQCQKAAATDSRIHTLVLDRPWLISALQEADLFLFGSLVEASPLVIVEAMASKTPFVSTNCGCVSDYADYGRVVDDVAAMAQATQQLLEDQKERERLAAAGYQQWQQHQTWEKVVDQYESVYQSLVRPHVDA